MSAFKDLVGSGAGCSGGNSLNHFTKQLQQDRSLQQDRFGPLADREGGSGPLLRSGRPILENDDIEEFLQAGGPGPSSRQQQLQQRGMFDMRPMTRELDTMLPPMMGDQNWGNEFSRFENAPQKHHHQIAGPSQSWINEFAEAGLEAVKELQEPPQNWANEFQAHQRLNGQQNINEPNMELEDAFKRAQDQASWAAEFAKSSDPAAWASEFSNAEAESWINEFKEQEGISVFGKDGQEALSQTAGMLLEAVAGSTNPKFQSSKFLGFMQQLRDQEVAIEGNKLVEQIGPAEAANSWAKEFGAGPVNKTSWEEDFNAQNTAAPPREADGAAWSEEFSGRTRGDQNWAQKFQNGSQMPDRDWNQQFQQQQQQQQARNMEWSQEFARNGLQQSPQASEAPMEASDDLDDLYKSAWDYENTDFSDFSAGRALGARYEQYEFTSNNPYLAHSRPPAGVRNLTEAILVLEAQVQHDPDNAKAWYELGIRQQENENDVGAIAALRHAVRQDPGLVDSWIALAVSLTNESAREDAYDALEAWIMNSGKYASLAAQPTSASSDRHQHITNMYIAAARMATESDMDADVQVGLGVLFNISEEYNKAIDCFEAALSMRPQDYMLWNKLGATLANARYSDRAMEAYFQALEINPSYVRARYNLSISCIQMQQYREAAEHLLGALSVQMSNINAVLEESKGKGPVEESDLASMHNVQSGTVWETLKMVADGHLRRHDLAEACEKRDLDAFRGEFDF
ncbi:hypothetical protein BDZ88DRAFT_412990 [Geranomyces variabilis]|nr:hypothetical protein BDZ88DRAFT_412990 [Geranomyces variabilis]KAJ3136858.1 hypothetical protein HDU90_002424 [Geranomyces variabilis]